MSVPGDLLRWSGPPNGRGVVGSGRHRWPAGGMTTVGTGRSEESGEP